MANRIQNPETISALRKLVLEWGPKTNTFAIVVRTEDGEEEIHERVSRPCFGEMRNYLEKSKNRPDDRFPGDLKNNFPDGTPIGVALCAHNQNEMKDYLFTELNPFLGRNKEFLENLEVITNKDGKSIGAIISSGDIPPTPLVATFMISRSFHYQHHTLKRLRELGVKDKFAVPLAMVSGYATPDAKSVAMDYSTPTFHTYSNLERVIDRNPIDLDNGMLWSDRCDYNRPYIAFQFVDDENVNPLHCIKYTFENFINKFKLLERE